MPRIPDARPAAWDVAIAVDVAVAVDSEGDCVGRISGMLPPASTVTVCVTEAPCCGKRKFGAMLMAGVAASHLHTPCSSPNGMFLYSPMTVYAKSTVLSKKSMTASRMNIGVGSHMPDFFGGDG